MKSQARAIIQEVDGPQQARLLLREYLQHLILRQLFEQKLLNTWIFHGGTALRIVYGINRFSEDLDFHLNGTVADYTLATAMERLCRSLKLQGYSTSLSKVSDRTVQSVFIGFEGLLHEFGLAPQISTKLNVKIEVDTRPPEGYRIQTAMINRYFPFSLQTHDLSTFLAGKLHAIFQRPYTKGRDFYDLVFLLSRWKTLEPNLSYLQNALHQTNYRGEAISSNNWRLTLANIVRKVDWNTVRRDVEPFLQTRADGKLLSADQICSLLDTNSANPSTRY